jgi:hypothetical protein
MASKWIQDVDPSHKCDRWRTPWATIWKNSEGTFTWFTWDASGVGGENDAEESLQEAKDQATLAAVRQDFLVPLEDYAPTHQGE